MNRSSPVGRAGKSLWVSKLSGVESSYLYHKLSRLYSCNSALVPSALELSALCIKFMASQMELLRFVDARMQ